MNARDVSDLRRRTSLLAAFLVLAAIGYVVMLAVVKVVVAFGEETFVSATIGNGRPLDVYIDVLAIDPIRSSMDVRLDVATGSGPHGTHYDGTFDRDIDLRVGDGDTETEVRLRRNGQASSRIFTAGLEGVIEHYPFDRYSTHLVMNAHLLSSHNTGTAIPIRATVWKGVPSWALGVAKMRPSDGSRELALAFGVYRPRALVVFACVIYVLMVLIAASATAIGALVFVGARRVEVGMVSPLAAMVFALPIVRNVLPGGPPLGVLGDVFILLWSEVAVALSLIVVVTVWVQRGSEQ